ncbi:MAG: hypothetical protein INR71_04055 [Terriglobus roseus]|nr:hypothetical protein [Terriglobus roseus]
MNDAKDGAAELQEAKHPAKADQLPADQVSEVLAAAKATVKQHISLMHRYNEIRDTALGLMGMLADQRGVRLRDVQEDFGMSVND